MTDGSTTQQHSRNAPLDSAFQVGDWLVDPGLNLIRDPDSGEQRHLEPRLMKLLCFLAANSGAVITREELVNLLWPRVIVNENSLTRAVSELRKRLDAPATRAREAVQTIPKRGYRLKAPVQALPLPRTAERAAAPDGHRSLPANRAGRHGGAAASLALAGSFFRKPQRALAAAATAGFCLMLGLNIIQQPAYQVLPGPIAQLSDEVVYSEVLTELPVSVSTFSLDNPDASKRSTAGIPATSTIDTPVLSPDRERFAFIERNLSASSIYVGRTEGTANSEFAPVQVLSVPYRLSNLTWSPVGNALLFARHQELAPAVMFGDSSERSELMRLDLDSGTVSRLVEDQDAPGDSRSRETNLTFLEPLTPLDNRESYEEMLAAEAGAVDIPTSTAARFPLPYTPA